LGPINAISHSRLNLESRNEVVFLIYICGTSKSFGSRRQADCDAAGISEEWARYFNTASVKDYNGFSIGNWWIANFQSCRNSHWRHWQSLPYLLRLNEVLSGIFLRINNMVRHVLIIFRSNLLPEIVGADQMCIASYRSELFME
jgi:hypothetical protein